MDCIVFWQNVGKEFWRALPSLNVLFCPAIGGYNAVTHRVTFFVDQIQTVTMTGDGHSFYLAGVDT
ncbi:Uncharacterised protein [Klebsiella pneumoniae]|uniref:Uncharacterized protein n=1 Tax=Klebsiella pneumoniae TaxID=573 RepID=A0A3S4GK33_KLEPN|nr:Uncharacterised protein [Klebsiella pneumoniae]